MDSEQGDEQRFPESRYPTTEELISAIKCRADDIESMTIQVPNGIVLQGPEGQKSFHHRAGAILKMHDGTSLLLHRDDAATLLNDGILSRLRKPVDLLPLVADPDDEE